MLDAPAPVLGGRSVRSSLTGTRLAGVPCRPLRESKGDGRLAFGSQLPAARYASTTSSFMRPRGETVTPLAAARARTAAVSTLLKAA